MVLPAACAKVAHLCTPPHPGPEYALRVVAGATAPGGIRGAPPTIRPKALVDDDACPKRVAPAEQWSLWVCRLKPRSRAPQHPTLATPLPVGWRGWLWATLRSQKGAVMLPTAQREAGSHKLASARGEDPEAFHT